MLRGREKRRRGGRGIYISRICILLSLSAIIRETTTRADYNPVELNNMINRNDRASARLSPPRLIRIDCLACMSGLSCKSTKRDSVAEFYPKCASQPGLRVLNCGEVRETFCCGKVSSAAALAGGTFTVCTHFCKRSWAHIKCHDRQKLQ